MVDRPRHHEEQVGQPVQVGHDDWLDAIAAERRIVSLDPPVDPVLLRYVNRLSDLLFVLARVANHRGGVPETEW